MVMTRSMAVMSLASFVISALRARRRATMSRRRETNSRETCDNRLDTCPKGRGIYQASGLSSGGFCSIMPNKR